MKRPQYVFRPNLNEPQHRRAWALLQQVPPAKRKEFLVQSILVAEQTDRLEKSIRNEDLLQLMKLQKHPQGGARGIAGSQHNQRCSKPTASECYTRLCARFLIYTLEGVIPMF